MSDELIDKEAEQNIIGAILIAPECMHELGELGVEDFASMEWGTLFLCCMNLWVRGETITSVSLLTEFERIAEDAKKKKQKDAEHLDPEAMSDLIAATVQQTVTANNASLIAHRLRSLAVRRRAVNTLKDILEDLKDTSKELTDVLDLARLSIDQLGWLPSSSRVVLFRDGIEIGGGNPIYEFNVVRPSDCSSVRIRLHTREIDERKEVRRELREKMHINPRLPDAKYWEDFVHKIVSLSTRTPTPEALEEDSHTIFWIREWFKIATPAEESDDLINGYVDRGEMLYVQPQRLIKWLSDHAKDNKTTVTELWAILQRHGARRDVSIRLKKGNPRKLWGIPAEFVTPTEDDSQMALEGQEAPLPPRAEDIDLGDFE